jgi:hypothetical protein
VHASWTSGTACLPLLLTVRATAPRRPPLPALVLAMGLLHRCVVHWCVVHQRCTGVWCTSAAQVCGAPALHRCVVHQRAAAAGVARLGRLPQPAVPCAQVRPPHLAGKPMSGTGSASAPVSAHLCRMQTCHGKRSADISVSLSPCRARGRARARAPGWWSWCTD